MSVRKQGPRTAPAGPRLWQKKGGGGGFRPPLALVYLRRLRFIAARRSPASVMG